MSNRHGWLILVTLAALLLAACGPEMATPTAGVSAPTGTNTSGEETAPATSEAAVEETAPPTSEAEVIPPGDLPVDPNDWRSLGDADAAVTITEYSDFQ